MALKVIFLDVDGVLLPQGEGAIPTPRGSLFLPQSMDALNFLVAKTGAVIVLSSTWRTKEITRNAILKEFTKYNKRNGGVLPLKFHDMTVMGHSVRQWEIFEWLSRHREVTNWIALDDEELLRGQNNAKLKSHFKGHVVQTTREVGFTMTQAEQAVKLLQHADAPAKTQMRRSMPSAAPSRRAPRDSELRSSAPATVSAQKSPARRQSQQRSPTRAKASANVSPTRTTTKTTTAAELPQLRRKSSVTKMDAAMKVLNQQKEQSKKKTKEHSPNSFLSRRKR